MEKRAQHRQARRIPPPLRQPAAVPVPASGDPRIVVSRWTGELATALMIATRDAIPDFAARLGIGTGTVGGWAENPNITPTPAKQRALDKALELADVETIRRFALLVDGSSAVWVPDSVLPTRNGGGTHRRQVNNALTAGLVAALAPPDAVERVAAASEWPVDAGLIDGLEAITGTFTAVYNERPPGVLIGPSRGHLKTVLGFLDEPMDPSDRVRLTSHAAEVALLVGWLSFNLNRRVETRTSWALAEYLAWQAGARDALARALGSASLLPSATFRGGIGGDTKAAVKLADQAYALAGACPPQARSYLAARAGVEHAAAKHPSVSARLFDDAQRALEQAEVSGEMGGVQGGRFGAWDQPRLDGFRGTALALLGRTDDADRCLSAALTEPLDDGRRVLLLADLGLARIVRHPEQACADLTEAHRFATLARYPNGVQRIRGVRARLDRRCDDLACVRELDGLLRVGR
ncbi:MAG: hypothetical protein ACRDYA_19960 [Egibacteraceae bacterium]